MYICKHLVHDIYGSLKVLHLMIRCRPHDLPRKLSSVYIPQTGEGTKTTLNKVYTAISKQENPHPDAALLVAVDFNAVTTD